MKILLPSPPFSQSPPPSPHHPQPCAPAAVLGPHADRTAGDYYDSSEDIMKMDEGAGSRLAGQYEIVMTQIP